MRGLGSTRVHDGPTRAGDVAIIERISWGLHWLWFGGYDHALSLLSCERPGSREIFERSGDPIWEQAVGEQAALSRDGNRFAFVSWTHGNERATGNLEVWDFRTRRGGPIGFTAVGGQDGGLGWFPDGRRVAVCALLPAADARLRALEDSELVEFRDSLELDGRVSCVFIVDVEAGTARFVSPGADVVVSDEGHRLLVRGGRPYPWFGDYGGDRPWRLIDLITGDSEPVRLPGDWRGAIALAGDLVVYLGLPPPGMPVKYGENPSWAVGAHPLGTVKVCELSSGRFFTVLSDVDPRTHYSWGPYGRE